MDEFVQNHFTPQLASAVDGDGLPSTVPVDQVYDLSTLDAIRAGDVVPVSVDDELRLHSVQWGIHGILLHYFVL